VIGRWGLLRDIRRCLRDCGLNEDQAGDIAPRIVAMIRERRDTMIAAAAQRAPMTDAQIAELWGIDRSMVVKIRKQAGRGVNDPAAFSQAINES